jgi:predicted nuclease of predicted toxin-antitoxin system
LIRFLANENIPLASVYGLRDAGDDVLAAAESFPGAGDPEVLARAHRESRILLTFDRDYGELIYRRGLPAPLGLVYFRFTPASPLHVAEVLRELGEIPRLLLEGSYKVVEEDRIRQRPLP